MAADDKFFIEIHNCNVPRKGSIASGDVYIQHRHGDRTILVLAHGVGSGIKSNTVANVVASMALNYTLLDEDPIHTAQAIVNTFYSSDSLKVGFTVLDLHRNGVVKVVECGNPHFALLRGDQRFEPECSLVDIDGDSDHQISLSLSRFEAMREDRMVLVSQGIVESGLGTRRLSEGWQLDGVIESSRGMVAAEATVSAFDLARRLMDQAQVNDLYMPKSDLSCSVLYFRRPRRILICSGPPFKESKDAILADMVASYDGSKLICGGTTAQIIGRELGREITVTLKRDLALLPSTSSMDGVDLITEGVLTLTKVKSLLERSANGNITESGTDGVVARMLLGHDLLEFVVGTRVNPMHQDPDLPIELELRRNLIKSLAALLENKFMKEVSIKYI